MESSILGIFIIIVFAIIYNIYALYLIMDQLKIFQKQNLQNFIFIENQIKSIDSGLDKIDRSVENLKSRSHF